MAIVIDIFIGYDYEYVRFTSDYIYRHKMNCSYNIFIEFFVEFFF